MWSSGDAIVMRHVYEGRAVMGIPMRVVDDRADALALWVAAGTRSVYPVAVDGRRVRPLAEWGTRPHVWYGNGNLDMIRPGRAHMIRHFWHDDGSFRGWYVNLQEPFRRTKLGIDTADHALDLWIDADGSVAWKDEDHLADEVAVGIFTAAEAQGVRAEAERVLEEWPFPTGWEDFRPEPRWKLPRLPAGWDQIR